MREKVIEAVQLACKQGLGVDVAVELERPEPQFGDYATNVAMKLSKELGKNPREIAQVVTVYLQENPLFANVGVAGPGFINITINDVALSESVKEEPQKLLSGMKVLVEYSDPNPFKPLHAGHLYTTIVGDVIARIVEHAGALTIRINYGGDVGLHVAKSMWAIIKELEGEHPEKLAEIPDETRAVWLGERYSAGSAAYEEEPQDKSEIIALNKKIYALHQDEDTDSPFAQIYWTCRNWSYDYFKELYKQLDIYPFDEYIPESAVTELGVKTVNEQLRMGVFEKSDGAVIFNGEKFGLHTRVFVNSEGLPTYETKDVGLSLTKWNRYQFDESIIITAHEQAQYMEVVIKAIEQFEHQPAERTRHITHGVVTMSDGQKMSSRKGNVLLARDMIEAARQVGRESGNAEANETVLAALKYALLKNRIGSDIAYNPEESIAMEGNSGPYLQYAHARARSILKKTSFNEPPEEMSFDKGERLLARALSEYTEVITTAILQLEPHHICTYLYELAQTFNRFYEQSHVVGSEREAVRVWLVQQYADTLQSGLKLLGISAPDSM